MVGELGSCLVIGVLPPLYVPNDYTHLNAEGHDVVAQAVARAFGSSAPSEAK